jgi:hypothetical protein
MGKFHHDLTVLPKPGIMFFFREIIPKWPFTIQVSEILWPLPRYICDETGFIYGQPTDPNCGLSHILRQGDRLKQLLDAMEDSQDFQVGAAVFHV